MGFLDGSSVTVDAILTKHGRLKLAEGGGLGITKFALADDEVDYRLWDTAHPNGSNYYGAVIENMPLSLFLLSVLLRFPCLCPRPDGDVTSAVGGSATSPLRFYETLCRH